MTGLGSSGVFNHFFDLWDDENAVIEHFNNNGVPLNANANWTGSFIFSGGINRAGWLPVLTLRDSTITANNSNGVTVYNSNGIYIENTVMQATGPWQVYSSNTAGNYQGAYLKNIYSESSTNANPLSPAKSPFSATGIAGLIIGPSSGAAQFQVKGGGGMQGTFQSGGSGTVAYSYFVVAKDTTASTRTSPMQILNYNSTGSDSIPVRWPRVANGTDVIAYDLIRIATPIGVGATYPYAGGCLGGSTTACGSVALNIAQCSALVCTYSDSGAAVTSNYTILQGNYGGSLIFCRLDCFRQQERGGGRGREQCGGSWVKREPAAGCRRVHIPGSDVSRRIHGLPDQLDGRKQRRAEPNGNANDGWGGGRRWNVGIER